MHFSLLFLHRYFLDLPNLSQRALCPTLSCPTLVPLLPRSSPTIHLPLLQGCCKALEVACAMDCC